MKKYLPLVISIIICQLAGIVGAVFTTPAIPTWYASLNKPFFNPPAWVFGPVWTLLYTLMGVAAYLVWKKSFDKLRIKPKKALKLFAVQLALNSLWSIIFFGLKIPFLAFLEILGLGGFIVLTMVEFRKISPRAFWLLLPYLLWVSFASLLNLAIVVLN
ncbi:MAG: TspO/MBR family protein [bacterium]